MFLSTFISNKGKWKGTKTPQVKKKTKASLQSFKFTCVQGAGMPAPWDSDKPQESAQIRKCTRREHYPCSWADSGAGCEEAATANIEKEEQTPPGQSAGLAAEP